MHMNPWDKMFLSLEMWGAEAPQDQSNSLHCLFLKTDS